MHNSLILSQPTKKYLFNIHNEDLFNFSRTNNSTESSQKEQSSSEEEFLCKKCNKLFSTKGNLQKHIDTIHENYRPFKCTFPNCTKQYGCESNLIIHERTHTGIKPFVCNICQKSFNENGHLKTHLRIHSEIRAFKCSLCDKKYKSKEALKEHIKINHYHIKMFNCIFCFKKFGTNSALKKHMIKHTKEKKFRCKFVGCGKCFTEKRNMEKHYKRHIQNSGQNTNKVKGKEIYFKIIKNNIANNQFNFSNNKNVVQIKEEKKNITKNEIYGKSIEEKESFSQDFYIDKYKDGSNMNNVNNILDFDILWNQINPFPLMFNLDQNIINNINNMEKDEKKCLEEEKLLINNPFIINNINDYNSMDYNYFNLTNLKNMDIFVNKDFTGNFLNDNGLY